MGKVFQALSKVQSDENDIVSEEALQAEKSSERELHEVEEHHESTQSAGIVESNLHQDSKATGEKKEPPTQTDWDEKIVTFFQQSAGLSENIRRLRSHIVHPQKGEVRKKILIASVGPGEGKSFVCASLGISIAQGLDEHALLVGCDLRRPSLSTLFNVNNHVGLVEHLVEGVDLGQLIKKTGMRKLSIIPSGPPPVNPSELLCSEKVGKMFSELDSRYDDRFIIVDTAPFEVASEVTVLAKHVDGIVLVVRWGKSGRDQVKKMVETLGREKILGVVFNAYETTLLSSKVSGYYGYGSVGQGKYE